MNLNLSDIATKLVGDKKRWKDDRARVEALPAGHRTVARGLERYLMNTGTTDGDQLMRMLDDLADLFERGAADGSDVHAIVGDDPIVFAEEFKANYGVGSWLMREQKRLRDAVASVERAPTS
jgi:DNA-binding ferritin-like protein (Dps family)